MFHVEQITALNGKTTCKKSSASRLHVQVICLYTLSVSSLPLQYKRLNLASCKVTRKIVTIFLPWSALLLLSAFYITAFYRRSFRFVTEKIFAPTKKMQFGLRKCFSLISVLGVNSLVGTLRIVLTAAPFLRGTLSMLVRTLM